MVALLAVAATGGTAHAQESEEDPLLPPARACRGATAPARGSRSAAFNSASSAPGSTTTSAFAATSQGVEVRAATRFTAAP